MPANRHALISRLIRLEPAPGAATAAVAAVRIAEERHGWRVEWLDAEGETMASHAVRAWDYGGALSAAQQWIRAEGRTAHAPEPG